MSATWDTKAIKAVPIAADEILVIDTADSRNQKRATLSSLGATFWSRNAGSGLLFPSTLTDKVGIGTITPLAPLHAGVSVESFGSLSFVATGAIITSTAGDQSSAENNILTLMRTGTGGSILAGVARFDMSRWEASGLNARTQLDIKLTHDATGNPISVLTMQSNGNIGIGKNNPTEALDIEGNVAAAQVRTQIKNLSSTGFADMFLINNISRSVGFQIGGSGIGGFFLPGISNNNITKLIAGGDNFVIGTSNNTPIEFMTNNLERMRITNDGNVGIGLQSPTELLQMFGGNFKLQPHNPTIVGTKDTLSATPRRIFVVNNHAYVVSQGGNSLTVLDITIPTSPVILATLTDAVNLNGAHDIFVAGRFAYIACPDGNRLTLIDISTPSVPVFKSQIAISGAFAVYVSGVHAYVTDKAGSRLVIIDIHNPSTLTQDGALTDATNFGNPTDVYVSGIYAYITGELTDSLSVVDISDDNNPTEKGTVFDSAAMNSPQAVYIVGNHAYVVSNVSDSLAIVNVGIPTAPSVTSSLINPTFESNSVLNGARHIFVSENHAYITSEDADSVTIVDIAIPATPLVVGSVNNGTTLNGAHGITVSGKFAYVTASTNNSMSVIDIHGMEMPNANIGNLEVGSLSVKDNVIIADDLYASSLNTGGDVLVGGQLAVTAKLSVFGDLTVADDLLTVNSTDKSVQIGGTTVAADFSIVQQSTQLKRGMLLTGNGFLGGTTTTDGVFLTNLFNFPGNTQFGIGQLTDFGNAAKTIFRYTVGLAVPNVGGVAGDGSVNRHITIGSVGTNVGVGFNVVTASQGDILSKLHVSTATAANIGLIVQAVGGQTANIFETRNSAGAVLNFFNNVGILDMGAKVIQSVLDPTNPQDAATKNYVDTSTVNGIWTKSGANIFPTTLTDKVGIGVTTPSATLHVFSSDAGMENPDGDADDLILENNGNIGYTVAPTVVIAAPPTTITAAGTAVLGIGVGAIASGLPSGTGYTNAGETVVLTGVTSGASNATGTATVSGGVIQSIAITNIGSGYSTNESLTIVGQTSGASDATAVSTTTQFVASITIDTAGLGYVTAPTITIDAATGSNPITATATSSLVNTSVTVITITNGGQGYLGIPAVAFTAAPTAVTATATANISGGKVISTTITNGGIGYHIPPSVVTFTGGDGNGVGTDTVSVANSSITSITVTAGGTGMTIFNQVNQVGVINFEHAGGPSRHGSIVYDHAVQRMRFLNTSVQGLIIDQLGHVAVSQDNLDHDEVFTVDSDILDKPTRILIADTVDRLMLGYNGVDPLKLTTTEAQVIVPAGTGDLAIASRGNLASNVIFYTSDGSTLVERMRVASEGVLIGDGGTLTSRSGNFLHLSTTNGVPNGTPTVITGLVPLAYDTVNDTLFVFDDGTWRQISSHTFGREIVITDQPSSSTAFQNSSLAISVKTGQTYAGTVTIFLNSAATPGLKYTFVIPANTANSLGPGTSSLTAPSSTVAMDSTTILVTDGTNQTITIHFRIKTTAAGNIIFRWARNGASGTANVLIGSSMVIWEEQ